MNRRIVLSVIAIGLAVSGCSTMSASRHMGGPSKTRIPCQGACDIIVTIVQQGDQCAVAPLDDIAVSGKNSIITWKIAETSKEFTFADSGVYIKPYADPDRQFSKVTEPADGRKFILHDANSLQGDRYYPYAIQIMEGAKRCVLYDPWIINQG
jgi:hypothetical protein